MKKKLYAVLLVCLCIQPMQAATIFDYIPGSFTIRTGDFIKGVAALFGIYYLARVCRYAVKQAAVMYVAPFELKCIDPALSGELIGVNAESGRDAFNFLMNLQQHKNNGDLKGPLGWIAYKVLTGEAESTLRNCPLFRKLPTEPGDKLNLATSYTLNANGSLLSNKHNPLRTNNPQCQVEALLQHTGHYVNNNLKKEAVRSLVTWSENSLSMKDQLQKTLTIARKDPTIAQILNTLQDK